MSGVRAADILRQLRYSLATLEVIKSVGSTNDEVLNLFDPAKPEPALCVSEEQTKGRGSFGKSWSSPAGGLYFSLAFVPRYFKLEESGLLSLITSLCLSRTLASLGLITRVKWPNDLIFIKEGLPYKLSGMLLEQNIVKDRSVLLVGIGVNVHAQPSVSRSLKVLPAISLEECGLKNPAEMRANIVAMFFNEFFATQRALLSLKVDTSNLIEQYNEKLLWRGEQVCVFDRKGNLMGEAQLIGVHSDGSIELKTHSAIQRVYSTEVSLRRR